VTEGQLTLGHLGQPRDHGPRAVYFLKFIDPLNLAEMARFRLQQGIEDLRDRARHFSAGRARLARVGYSSRILDAIYMLTLLLRGRVPGDTAAAAALIYSRMQRAEERYTYYARVIQEAGWTILQYWFFYPYNNWRSGFHGANDHEADWEMISVYLAADHGRALAPRWVAYASHDFSGDDLRRRWDDPELEKVDGHPVIYVGAGSHASYFVKGEYLTEIELPFMAPLTRVQETLQRFVAPPAPGTAEAGEPEAPAVLNLLRVPLIDFARGDGLALGPSQEKVWQPVLIDPAPSWVERYRGLWGLFVRDPVAGEDAPSGPMYNRDGSVRRAWADPLGWSGLDKVLPPARLTPALRDEIRASGELPACASRFQAPRPAATGLRLAATSRVLLGQGTSPAHGARARSRELEPAADRLAPPARHRRGAARDGRTVRRGEMGSPRAHLGAPPAYARHAALSEHPGRRLVVDLDLLHAARAGGADTRPCQLLGAVAGGDRGHAGVGGGRAAASVPALHREPGHGPGDHHHIAAAGALLRAADRRRGGCHGVLPDVGIHPRVGVVAEPRRVRSRWRPPAPAANPAAGRDWASW
jgi:hypothetical protein